MQFVLLEDASSTGLNGYSRLYCDPCAVLRLTLEPDLHTLSENEYAYWQQKLQCLLDEAEAYSARGWYAVLICHYELCSLLHHVPIHTTSEPLIELQFYQQYQSLNAQQVNDFLNSQSINPHSSSGSKVEREDERVGQTTGLTKRQSVEHGEEPHSEVENEVSEEANVSEANVKQSGRNYKVIRMKRNWNHHPAGVMNIQPSIDQAQFEHAFARLKDYLLRGHSYQINFSYRLFFDSYGSPITLYQRLRARQPVPFSALMRTQHGWVLSFSPELFVRRQGQTLSAKPMKGTAPRSGVADESEAVALKLNEKERTENLIIVDLLRNDLGRISQTGSVTVPNLFEVEAHPTVWQMTSTIHAQSQTGLRLYQLLQALFPCGSVTGAPKRRSLEIIHELEQHPRRLYCGALGWIDPPVQTSDSNSSSKVEREGNRAVTRQYSQYGEERRSEADKVIRMKWNWNEPFGDFCFSVPIRTLLLDEHGKGELGIGAGITYASSAAQEYAECQTKARFLTQLLPEFSLFETFALNAAGYIRLPQHLQRLQNSARTFGFVYCEDKIYAALAQYKTQFIFTEEEKGPSNTYRVRLCLTPQGEIGLSSVRLDPIVAPVKLMWAEKTCFGNDILLRHKTTYRAIYDEAWQTAQSLGCFDALLCNERGEVTEGGRSNVFVKINQQWFTPAIDCGLLPGVMRAELIKQLQAQEAVLYPSDIIHAQECCVCNSLRGALVAFF